MRGTMITKTSGTSLNIMSAFEKDAGINMNGIDSEHVHRGKLPGYGRLVEGGKAYKDNLVASLNRTKLCTKTSNQ